MHCPLPLYIDMEFGALPLIVNINSVQTPPDSAKTNEKSAKYPLNGPSISFDRSRLCRVGETVGERVGDTVGAAVGDIVGTEVGEAEGDAVGVEVVGDTVGVAVGDAVAAMKTGSH